MFAGSYLPTKVLRPNLVRLVYLKHKATPPQLVNRAVSTSTGSTSTGITNPRSWDIRMLYDGDCPLCMKEVNFLRQRDAGKGKIDFVDIAASDYNPADNQGITFEQAMDRIHAILPDGRVVVDVEVFRLLYEAVGLGWVYAITKIEPIGNLANLVYNVWAKNRLQLTGREAMELILEKRNNQAQVCGVDKASCDTPST